MSPWPTLVFIMFPASRDLPGHPPPQYGLSHFLVIYYFVTLLSMLPQWSPITGLKSIDMDYHTLKAANKLDLEIALTDLIHYSLGTCPTRCQLFVSSLSYRAHEGTPYHQP